MFEEHFQAHMDRETLDKQVKNLRDLVEFLEALPEQIPECCVRLREYHGEDFNINVAAFLIDIRGDLDIVEKRQALIGARDALSKAAGPIQPSNPNKRRSILVNQILQLEEQP